MFLAASTQASQTHFLTIAQVGGKFGVGADIEVWIQ